jgi:hypothetical protein
MRTVRPVGQPGQPSLLIAAHPGMHRLAGHPVTFGHLNDRQPGLQNLQDGVIALFHDAQLHEHQPRPLHATIYRVEPSRERRCHPSGEAGVSPISRSRTRFVDRGGEDFPYSFKAAASRPHALTTTHSAH